jgi:hypothetical protein
LNKQTAAHTVAEHAAAFLCESEIDAASAVQQEAYNKEFERAALFDVLMRETPRPDGESTGLLK